jgi:dTDP-4-dehydrorhamnose 3,5-epimerase
VRFEPLPIAGAFRIETEPAEDARGFFARLFDAEEFRARGLTTNFVQRSLSFNRRRGTLRGLHYQAEPHAETKIVRCTRGAAFDVMADLRPDSPSFRRWHGVELTADNRTAVYIPTGCAHGFQALADDTELYYEITPAYVPEAARGVRFDDPALAIGWPIAPPIVSDRDRTLPLLEAAAASLP